MILAHTAVNFYMGNITDDPVHPNASPPNAPMHTPRLSVFAGTVDFRLTSMGVTDASVRGRYCHMYTLINSTCAVLIPIVGHVMDTWGFTVTWVITVTLAVIWTSLLLLESISLLLLSFFFAALFRTFLYTFIFAYLADAMGFRYFGLLSGILFAICGVAGLTQYQLGQWARGGCAFDPLPSANGGGDVAYSCDSYRWRLLNFIVLLGFLASYMFCALDYADRYGESAAAEVRDEESGNVALMAPGSEPNLMSTLLGNKTSTAVVSSSQSNYCSISDGSGTGESPSARHAIVGLPASRHESNDYEKVSAEGLAF